MNIAALEIFLRNSIYKISHIFLEHLNKANNLQDRFISSPRRHENVILFSVNVQSVRSTNMRSKILPVRKANINRETKVPRISWQNINLYIVLTIRIGNDDRPISEYCHPIQRKRRYENTTLRSHPLGGTVWRKSSWHDHPFYPRNSWIGRILKINPTRKKWSSNTKLYMCILPVFSISRNYFIYYFWSLSSLAIIICLQLLCSRPICHKPYCPNPVTII